MPENTKQKIILWILIVTATVFGLALSLIKLNSVNYIAQPTPSVSVLPIEPTSTQHSQTSTDITTTDPNNPEAIPTSTLLAGEDMSTSVLKYTNLPSDLFNQNFVWQKPEKIQKLGMFVENYSPCGSDLGPGCQWYQEKTADYFKIANFNYNNQLGEVIMTYTSYSGFESHGANYEYFFVKWNEQLVLLKRASFGLSSDDGLNKTRFVVDKNLALPSFNFEQVIDIPGKEKLYFESYGNISNELLLFTDNKVKTFNKNNPDSIFDIQDYMLVFIDGIHPLKYNIKLPAKFIFNDNSSALTSKYEVGHPSCGGLTGVDIVSEYKKDDLENFGVADNKNPLFKLKDTKDGSELKEMYTNYVGYAQQNNKQPISFEQFLASKPLVIMQDGFGRYVRFKAKEFYIQLAECGKPVIYLYPTKETKVNVQVAPNGGLTKVDPFYPTGGWLVNAKPNGELTNSEGQKYPYLFWEGKARDLKIPTDGFVLKKEKIKTDLPKILTRLGLNEKEIADFLEFWQLKLELKPYVFVTFVSQADFDKVAPLNITPRPDKIIRIFMDYQPLDFPINVHPLYIKTPVRTGFTAVEWGGRLHQ